MSSPKGFRVIKPEIRVLGIDDGKFTPHTQGDSLIVGVVFRGGSSIDGVMHTKIGIDALDATDKITTMINESPHCRQLRLVMLYGITFAGFNLVDIQKLHHDTDLPVIALTHDKPDLDAIHEALKHLPNMEERWRIVQNAGEIHSIKNKGATLYMGLAGITLSDALKIVDLTSTRGSFPEPLRVAHLIASGITP
ncbi:MAG: DUF99 family protein [Candidatus Bathyarchaeota archaeon]|nr:DUF99 family protein [Chloroflexota bacterium]MCL5878108.1 DUF99 family protein [Candidatus Bathyarchaeota archaeon]